MLNKRVISVFSRFIRWRGICLGEGYFLPGPRPGPAAFRGLPGAGLSVPAAGHLLPGVERAVIWLSEKSKGLQLSSVSRLAYELMKPPRKPACGPREEGQPGGGGGGGMVCQGSGSSTSGFLHSLGQVTEPLSAPLTLPPCLSSLLGTVKSHQRLFVSLDLEPGMAKGGSGLWCAE